MKRLRTAFGPLFIGLGTVSPLLFSEEPAANPARRPAVEESVVWRPASFDDLEFDRRFAQELFERGFSELAAAELERIAPRLETASDAERLRFAATAIRVAVEVGDLATPDGRAVVAQKIVELRNKSGSETTLNDETNRRNVDSALDVEGAFIRALFELGVLAGEATAVATETGSSPTEETRYLENAVEISKSLVRRLETESARSFVYWSAKILTAQVAVARDGASDENAARLQSAEKAAVALENASQNQRDALYFLAILTKIEAARLREDFETASARISEMERSLSSVDSGVASAVANALVSEKIRALAAAGKTEDALQVALSSPAEGRDFSNFGAFFDAESARNFASAELFWRVATAKTPPDALNGGARGDSTDQEVLIDAAKRASARLSSNFWRTRAARLVRDAAQSGGDRRALEAAAEENYRRENWEAAIADFDRASLEAAASGDAESAFRLAGASAAIVDKILRDKIFERGNAEGLSSTDPGFWRSEAVRRFDELARSRSDDPTAPRLFLLALRYSEEAEAAGTTEPNSDATTARRFEYLRLFPAAENRGAFAVDAARRAFSAGRFDDAAAFLDFVAPNDPDFPSALETERRLAQARLAALQKGGEDSDQSLKNALFADVVRRFLAKTTAGNAVAAVSTSPETALAQTAKNLTRENLSESDSAVLTVLFETVLATEFLKNDSINAAFDALLTRWEEAFSAKNNEKTLENVAKTSETASRIASFRLAVLIDANKTEDVLRRVADVENASPETAEETLERLLELAEKSALETRRTLGVFVLSALDSLGETGADSDSFDRRTLARARAFRLVGRTQDALALFARLRQKNPKNVAAVRGIARILSEQIDEKSLELALKYWSDVADLVPTESTDWWDAKERCVEIYSRLGRKEQAAKMTKTIWLTRSDPRDPGRRARWERLCL